MADNSTLIEVDGDNRPFVGNAQVRDADKIQGGKLSVFKSTEQTGTGSSQDVAHGLGRVPSLVLVFMTESAGAGFDVAEGAHDATNVKVTVTTGEKFKVVAL